MNFKTVPILLVSIIFPQIAVAQTIEQYRDTIITYWENGQKKLYEEGIITVYMSGDSSLQTDGAIRRWYKNGQLQSEGYSYIYEHPHRVRNRVGEKRSQWYENGILKSSGVIVAEDTLFVNEQKQNPLYMFAYKLNRVLYYETGKIQKKQIWQIGKCNKVTRIYYDSKKKLTSVIGKAKGYCYCNITEYHPNGKIKEKGKLSADYAFAEGNEYPKIGIWKYYDERGKLIGKKKY